MEPVILDIGGLDKTPVDRGLTVRRRGDFLVVNVGQNDMYAAIELNSEEVARLRDALTSGMTLEERATEAVDTLFDVSNKMSSGEETLIKVMVEAMHRQHRTLIQKFWGVIAKVIAAYAALPDNLISDLRNQDSHEWAKKVARIESHMRYI